MNQEVAMAWQGMANTVSDAGARVKNYPAVRQAMDELTSLMQTIDSQVYDLHRRVCGERPEAVSNEPPVGETYSGLVGSAHRIAERVAGRLREIGEQV